MKAAQWFASTVLRPAMPGSTLLRPPENPAKKCGSMNPSATSRSASAARRWITSASPEGSVPRQTRFASSSQS